MAGMQFSTKGLLEIKYIALVAFESRLSVHEYHNIHSEDVAKNFIVWVACGISFFHEPLHASNSVRKRRTWLS